MNDTIEEILDDPDKLIADKDLIKSMRLQIVQLQSDL